MAQEKKEEKTLDAITTVRAKNNFLWMELVKIAVEVVPDRGIPILKKIIENDAQIMACFVQIINAYEEDKDELCDLDSH